MKRVLILEDEPLIALDLRYACEDVGIEPRVVASSRQALDALAGDEPIDGAVLDVNLGRGETCEAVAKILKERGVPFVLNTGDLNRAGEYLRGMDAPILSKPSAADAVVAKLLELGEQPEHPDR